MPPSEATLTAPAYAAGLPPPEGALPTPWLAALDSAGIAAAIVDPGSFIIGANARFAAAAGSTIDGLAGRVFAEINPDPRLASVFQAVRTTGAPHRESSRAGSGDVVPLAGVRSWDWFVQRLGAPRDGSRPPHLLIGLREATERDTIARHWRTTAVLDARMRLSELSARSDVDALMRATIDDAEHLTGSKIGFFHFVDDDEETIQLAAWSSNTLATMCTMQGKGTHYPVSSAGVWADCIRTRRPVVHNDYAALPKKHELPEGHAPVVRELTVPVLVDGKVVACISVGNKPTTYDDVDVAAVSELTHFAIELVIRKRAEQMAREQAGELRTLFESMTSGFALYEVVPESEGAPLDLRILNCNPAFESITGLRRDEIAGKTVRAVLPATDALWIDRFARVSESGDCAYFDDYSNDIGRQYRLTAYRPQAGRCAVLYDDITALRRSQESLREAAAVVSHIRDGVTITDAKGKIIAVNPAFTEITGYAPEEVVGKNPKILQSGRHDAAYYQAMWSTLGSTGFWQGEIWNRRKDGTEYPEWLTITSVLDDAGQIERYIGVFTDIGRIRQAEERAKFVERHDSLTGLPNRSLIGERYPQALQRAMQRGHKVALLILDLDLFKNINDSLGHEFGDRLLIEIAGRFKHRLRPEDILARLGGDEFGVLMEDLADSADAAILARALLDAFNAPFRIGEADEIYLSASIGISVSPDDATDQSTLMRNADAAVFLAKSQGRKTFRFYTESLTKLAQERIQLESRLRKAIELEQLVLHFQPLVDVKDGTVIGSEALVRWQDPENGLVSPMRFIPVAEESGLIAPLGAWVLKAACRQMKSWLDAGRDLKTVTVNLSPRQFALQDVPAVVQAALEESGLPAAYLELEITEGILLEHGEGAIAVLNALRRLGVRLSIDDFGTGYSSLSYLKRFPIDKLKIDQSFVRDLQSDQNDAEIVTTIIAMARALKLSVLAEGVETAGQLAFLDAQGCDFYQGYLFSRPVPAEQFPFAATGGA